jgi:2-isopropylmalate synthase
MAMRVREDALNAHTDIDVSQIGPASRLVERLTGSPVPPNKAIVGANAFAHEAGIHQDGLLKDVATYQIIDPGELGLVMTLPLGKHSGRHAFSRACEEAGLRLDKSELREAFTRFKARADLGGAVSIHELVQEVMVP